jgi:hypothetical protein
LHSARSERYKQRMAKPNRTTVSKQLTLSPLAAGVLGALEDLGVGGSAGAVVERLLEERVVGATPYPDVWGIGAATVLRQRAAGRAPDEIAAEVRRVMVTVLEPGSDANAVIRELKRPISTSAKDGLDFRVVLKSRNPACVQVYPGSGVPSCTVAICDACADQANPGGGIGGFCAPCVGRIKEAVLVSGVQGIVDSVAEAAAKR